MTNIVSYNNGHKTQDSERLLLAIFLNLKVAFHCVLHNVAILSEK